MLIFQFLSENVIKICDIQVVRQPLVSLPLFWFKVSSKSFYEITKNPNFSFEMNKHSNNSLSGRYIADGEALTENYDSKRYIDISVKKFGVCHKSVKSNPTISETIDTVPLRRKIELYNSTMSGGLLSTQKVSVKYGKINWPTHFDGPSCIKRENSVSFPPTGADI